MVVNTRGRGGVAVRRALGRPLERGGADERGRFRVDQLLVERLGRDPNPVGDIGEFQLAKKVEQGRLVKSNRVLCPCREIFDRFSPTNTRWLFTSTIRRSEPGKPHTGT